MTMKPPGVIYPFHNMALYIYAIYLYICLKYTGFFIYTLFCSQLKIYLNKQYKYSIVLFTNMVNKV